MVNRLDKIWQISYEMESKLYSRPKLITFALPSVKSFNIEASEELSKLKALIPQARSILQEHGVLGGVYVPEVTTREIDLLWFKHHAHIHMVAIAPYMNPKALKKFCECLMPLGLGRINYVAPSGHWKSAKRKVASYISKYLCKEGRRTSSFGIYRNYSSSTGKSANRKQS